MLTLMPPGWKSSKSILCTGETVATSWKQSLGLISWAEDAMRKSQFKNLNYNFNDKGNTLTATMTLPKIKKVSSAPLKTLKDLRHELNKTFEELGVKVSFQPKTITVKAKNTSKKKNMGKINAVGKGGVVGKGAIMGKGKSNTPSFKNIDVLTFSFKSEYTPLVWLKFLTKFSALVTNSSKALALCSGVVI